MNAHASQAVVLLSGGLDSVAALFWARQAYREIRAIAFRYGQPAADAEIVSAGRACAAVGAELSVLVIADALATRVGLLRAGGAPPHDSTRVGGIDPANVPARNIVFASIAAHHACAWFRAGSVDLVLGCNLDDADHFPDCHPRALDALSTVLRLGSSRNINIRAPWITFPKRYAAAWAKSDPACLDALSRSWSCYHRKVCGVCGACVKRRDALDAAGIVDACEEPTMHGGDASRERR